MTSTQATTPHLARPGAGRNAGRCRDCHGPAVPSEVHHPPGASLHLGGSAWAHPDLLEALVPVAGDVAGGPAAPALPALEPYPGNARRGDQDAITASLADLGLYRALIVQRSSGHVLAGNHTLCGLLDLGAERVPVTWVDVDDDRARAIVLRDNKTSDLGGYDNEALLALLAPASENADLLALTGYAAAEVAALRTSLEPATRYRTNPDDAPDVSDRTPITQPGDVWHLGRHRLLCGDATSPADVRRLLDGERAALVFTDPPYGVSYVGGTKDRLTIANDNLSAADLRALLDGAFLAAEEALAPGAAFYVCSPSGTLETIFRLALDAAGLPLRQQIVWIKDRFVLGRADYHGRHETILYGNRPADHDDPEDGEALDPTPPPPFDPVHDTLLYGWKPGAAHTWVGGRRQDTVWDFDRPAASRLHPTMKPVALVQRAVENNTEPGAVVLDQFGGSGSTLIASERSDRAARLLELDPAYVDVICRRYQEHTGTVPVRDGEPVDFTTESTA